MSKCLVTGGAGFIGSHIVEAFLARGISVRVLDDFSTGKRENIAAFENDVEMIEGDIRDPDLVSRSIEGVDCVVHQAALASVQRSIEDPAATNLVNVQGTLNLLDASVKRSVRRFVYASSSSVYGDSEELPKKETMETNPRSPYAVSKLAGEWYCRVFSEVFGLPTICLRYFNVFGPRQDPNSQYSAVIPIFVKSLIERKPPTIFGDGEQSRDFTYVDNVVNANMLSCDCGLPGNRVYNVACGDRFTLNSLYEKLQNIIGADVKPNYGPPRAGDVRHSQASIQAISSELGYDTTVGFEEGLLETVNWYRDTGLADA